MSSINGAIPVERDSKRLDAFRAQIEWKHDTCQRNNQQILESKSPTPPHPVLEPFRSTESDSHTNEHLPHDIKPVYHTPEPQPPLSSPPHDVDPASHATEHQ